MIAQFILPVLLFAGLYFFVLRPQQQKVKAQQAAIRKASAGDRVLLTSGIYGSITEVLDTAAYVELAEGIEILVARASIQELVDDFPTAASDVVDADASDDEG